MLPYDLAVALAEHFTFQWSKQQRAFKQRHGRETTRLFLSQYGNELSRKYLNNAFDKASQRTGITCTPHMLRHTFGTYELIRMMRKREEKQALLWVKDRLGHSSIMTTEMYVHAVDLIQHDTIDGYQQILCKALRDGYSTPTS